MTRLDLIALVVAYLVGAIPTGLLIGKWFAGIDLRQHGSLNIGFTNAYRVLGWKLGVPVLLIDVGKGLVAVLAVPLVAGPEAMGALAVYCGLAAVAGNMFNVFLGLKGGKGVATGLGVFVGLAPLATLFAFGAFAVCVVATRYISLASLVALPVLAGGILLLQGAGPLFWVSVVVALVVVIKHRGNIKRLMTGTERRFGAKEPASKPKSQD